MIQETIFLPEDTYEFLGSRLRVRSNSEAALDRLRLMYARFRLEAADGSGSAGNWFEVVDNLERENLLVIRDDCVEYRLSRMDRLAHFTCQDLESGDFESMGFCDPLTLVQSAILRTVARRVEGYGLFHAGVVSSGGRAMILAARGRMGKTTLVLNLLRHGCEFLSDEVACLDPSSGIVVPFPRKINMRKDAMDILGLPVTAAHTLSGIGESGPEYAVDAEAIPGVRLSGPCPANWLLFLRGFADDPLLEPVAPSNALFELMNYGLTPLRDPGRRLFDYAPVVDSLACHNLVAGEPDPTAALVLSLIRGEGAAG